ncbi:MAG TPA: tetratricopeptide repeat protein [Verrucomicrobiae bacterium]|nr:tetratricopeptide repeat protein [Verrucomicrobiae bacterium]
MQGKLQRILSVAAIALTLALPFLLALEKVHESDSLWHLKTGEWILSHRQIPRADVFSSTVAGKPWLDWEWLFQVAMYSLYTVDGFSALVFAKAALVAFTAALLLDTCRRNGASVGQAALVVMLAFVAARERLEVRPDVALLFFAAASVAILEAARLGKPKWLLALPLLQVVWVNTHPSFLLGLALAGAYGAEFLLRRRWTGMRWWALALGLTCAACLANPYGVDLVRHAIAQSRASGPAGVIGEWLPTLQVLSTERNWATTMFRWLFALTPLAVVARLVVERGKFPWAHALVLAGMSVLALRANRFTAVYAIVTAPILASALGVLVKDRFHLVVTTVSLAVAVFLSWAVVSNRWAMAENRAARFGVGLDEQTAPTQALAELRKIPNDSGLFNTFLSGGPLIWSAYPQWRVFCDGRANLYGREFVDQYRAAMRDPEKWEAWMRRRDVSVVFLQYGTGDDAVLLQHLAQDPDWSLRYFDQAACIFVRGSGAWPGADALCLRARDVADTVAGSDKYAWGRAMATMGDFLMVCGKAEAAERLFEDAIAVNPHASEAWMNLGVIERNRGHFDRALELIGQLLARNPYYYQARLMRAEIEAARGDVAAAVREVERVLKRAPHSGQAWFIRAQLAAREGDRRTAIAALERVVSEKAEDQTVYWFLARLLAIDGRTNEAAVAYENCLRVWVDAPQQREQVERELAQLRGGAPNP